MSRAMNRFTAKRLADKREQSSPSASDIRERPEPFSSESITAHAPEDYAISMTASHIADELTQYVKSSERAYFSALLVAVARHPWAFRRRGYTTEGMTFRCHEGNRGRCVHCEAYFPYPFSEAAQSMEGTP